MAFEVVKQMQAGGLEWGEGYRPLGRRTVAEIIEGRMPAQRSRRPAHLLHYKTLAERKQVRTTNAIERRFRVVRRRTRPMGTFQDRTSMDRILFAIFTHQNKRQGIATPFPLTHNN